MDKQEIKTIKAQVAMLYKIRSEAHDKLLQVDIEIDKLLKKLVKANEHK